MQPWGIDQFEGPAAPLLEWHGVGGSARRPLDRPLRIGRDAASDICLTEQSVSRQHAVITVVAGQIVVDASSSTNGISRPVSRSSSSLLLGTTFSYPG
jgi:pSer/pThr/pTyr-binding forkhead associated (FHA) protein